MDGSAGVVVIVAALAVTALTAFAVFCGRMRLRVLRVKKGQGSTLPLLSEKADEG
jgi:hypothetical protein